MWASRWRSSDQVVVSNEARRSCLNGDGSTLCQAGAELYQEAVTHGSEWGINIDPAAVTVDWDKVMGRSREITGSLNNGVGFLFKKNGSIITRDTPRSPADAPPPPRARSRSPKRMTTTTLERGGRIPEPSPPTTC